MISKTYRISIAWGLLHGINDWVAGYMIMSYSQHQPLTQSSLALIIYTVIGFGGQLPVGMWLDRYKNVNPFINASLVLLTGSIVCFWVNNLAGIVVAGLSSAFLHITGGSICLKVNNDKTGPLGVFTAPGVLGLTLGIASAGLSASWLSIAILAIIFILVTFNIRLSMNGKVTDNVLPKSMHQQIEGHDWVMIAILLVITLRSLLYEVISIFAHNWQTGLLTIGIAAFAGKIIGGFVADKIGWKNWVYISLPLAFIFLQLGQGNLLMLAFGISCLQSSVPISLMLMSRNMPAFPATATAMTLGAAIAIAALFQFIVDSLKIKEGWYSYTGITAGIFIILLVFVFLKRKKQRDKYKLRQL